MPWFMCEDGMRLRVGRAERARPGGGALPRTVLAPGVPPGPTGPAGPAGPAGLLGEQVIGGQQDGRADDGGKPGRDVEEALQAVDVEQLGGQPAAQQRPDDPDDAGQDQPLRPAAGDKHIGDEARDEAQNNPGDDAHDRLLLVSDAVTHAVVSHAGQIATGEGTLPSSHRPWLWRLAAPFRAPKKSGPRQVAMRSAATSAARSGAIFIIVPFRGPSAKEMPASLGGN